MIDNEFSDNIKEYKDAHLPINRLPTENTLPREPVALYNALLLVGALFICTLIVSVIMFVYYVGNDKLKTNTILEANPLINVTTSNEYNIDTPIENRFENKFYNNVTIILAFNNLNITSNA